MYLERAPGRPRGAFKKCGAQKIDFDFTFSHPPGEPFLSTWGPPGPTDHAQGGCGQRGPQTTTFCLKSASHSWETQKPMEKHSGS